MTITLTEKQQEIVDRAVAAVRRGENFTVTGLAGTGKTVVLAMLARRLRDEGLTPQVCAPTGKAAQNVTKKFPELTAKTLHSALAMSVNDRIAESIKKMEELSAKQALPDFSAEDSEALEQLAITVKKLRETADERLKFQGKTADMLAFDVILFDEASMIGYKIWDDLIAALDLPMVFFGDHGQLPPVKDKCALDLPNADGKLTEVHRQKADSGILKVAYAINNGERIDPEAFAGMPDVTIIGDDSFDSVLPYADTHQVVVWKHADRHPLNQLLRQRRLNIVPTRDPSTWTPVPGERLLCDQNSQRYKFMNGDELEVCAPPADDADGALFEMKSNPYLADVYLRRIGDPDEAIKRVTLNLGNLMPSDFRLDGDTVYKRESANEHGLNTCWRYAITCHKAQGSEYPHVCVFRPCTIPSDRKKWLYTACTRAQKSLVIISSEFAKPKKVLRNGLTPAQRLAKLRQTA